MPDVVATTSGKRLEGELGFATVRAVLGQASTLIASGSVDLAGVTRVDSAGLALLLELARRARAAGRDLVFEGADERIVRLARFYGLNEVLRFGSAV